MAGEERKFISPVNIQHFFSSLLKNTEAYSTYMDTQLICKDRVMFNSKFLLAMAFPFLETPLAILGEMVEPVVILPDYTSVELMEVIQTFLAEPEAEICEQTAGDNGVEFDLSSKDTLLEEVFVLKEETKDEFKDDIPHEIDLYLDSSQVCLNSKCFKYFSNMGERDLHMQTCQVLIKCKFCNETFATEGEKKVHEECYISSDGQFMCEERLKQSCQMSMIKCQFCKETFANKEEKSKHQERYINSDGQIVCGFANCGIVLDSRKSLVQHTQKVHLHQEVKTYSCYFCDANFTGKHTYLLHLKICTFATVDAKSENKDKSINSGRLKCEFEDCGVILKSRKTLVQHIKFVHLDKKVKAISCYFCSKTFKGRSAYTKHKEGCTGSKDNYKCPQEECGFKSKDQRSLISHFTKHHGVCEYSCEICGKQYTTQQKKANHMKNHKENRVKSTVKNQEAEDIPCPICSKVLKNKNTLSSHLSITHGDEESKVRFKSNQFQKGFALKKGLKYHLLTHTDERNCTCPSCGKKFKSLRDVRKHEKIHSGEKPYKCSHCGKGFINPDKVRRHEAIHTGTMDFSCSICGKKFNQKGNLNTHEKKCTGCVD